MWLDAFPDDFRDPPDYPLLNQFLVFCEHHAKDSELHFKVKHRMERLIKNPEPRTYFFPFLQLLFPPIVCVCNCVRKNVNGFVFMCVCVCVFCFFPFRGVTVDQSPSIQRILATNPDLTYSGNDSNGGSSVNGICNSGDTADASLHAIFLELSEKHMAEQLTRLDTVRYLNRFFFHFPRRRRLGNTERLERERDTLDGLFIICGFSFLRRSYLNE